jgi:hypothetical protein
LDELHIGERVLGECDCLAEALIEAVGHINCGDNDLLQTRFKMVRLLHHSFQVG